ncbi:MAG: hypothetical protein IJH63_12980, partial [Methanobrevibacter sp.]|nr:hypothetical protein [Methanobrevibacter sp.]
GGLFKMIINKEQITIDKFEVRLYNKTYLILTYEKSKDGFTEFYITEKESCIVSFCIGCKYKEIIPRIESFIKRFIDEWVDDYNQEIDLLEDYTGA